MEVSDPRQLKLSRKMGPLPLPNAAILNAVASAHTGGHA